MPEAGGHFNLHVYPAVVAPPRARKLSIVTTTDPFERALPLLLNALDQAAEALDWSQEVIIVDDLDYWPSSEEPGECRRPHLCVKVIRYPGRRGQLAAMTLGTGQATGDAVMVMDPDMWSCVVDLPIFLERLKQGWMIVHGARRTRHLALPRRLGSWLSNMMVRRLTGIRVSDISSPMTAFSSRLAPEVKHIPEGIRNLRLYLYALNVEATCEVEIADETKASHSHYRIRDLARLFAELLRQCLRLRAMLRGRRSA